MNDKQTIAVLLGTLERLVRAIEVKERIDENVTVAKAVISHGKWAIDREQHLEKLTPEMRDVIAKVFGKDGSEPDTSP